MAKASPFLQAIWHNNPALVQMLGLCPLLAVSNTLVNALGLGLATLFVLIGSNLMISLLKNRIHEAIRLPAFVLIIASFVTLAELLMQAYAYKLNLILGIFLPLIVTNCLILARAESYAKKNGLLPAFIDGLSMGFGFLWVLLALGFIREALGQATLFANMQLLFGEGAKSWQISFSDSGILLALLPPGAFILLGFIAAFKNWIDEKQVRLAGRNKKHS